jgi:hypothetical protein
MKLSMTKINLKRLLSFDVLLILFWGGWLGIVALTDTMDYLQVLSIVPDDHPLCSKNYKFLTNFVSNFCLKPVYVHGTYLFILFYVYGLMYIFVRQFYFFWRDGQVEHLGFFCKGLILLTGAFILADEFFVQYECEHGHLIRFMAQMVTLMYLVRKETH